MIYLVTGTPGLGKTAMVMSWVLNNKFGLFKDGEGNDRPIFSVGIEYTKPKRLPINEVALDEFVQKPLHENFPVGSVIIVDEASEVYPKRPAARQLPTHVEGLNRLRHYGLTLIIITQRHTMIDSFVCDLVGKHLHLERKQIGSKLYEWNHFQSAINATAFSTAYSQWYKVDNRVKGLYVSAAMHIEFRKSRSWYWYLILLLPIVIGLMYWGAMSIIKGMGGDEAKPKPAAAVVQQPPAAAGVTPPTLEEKLRFRAANAPPPPQQVQTLNLTASDFIPTVDGHDESAPIYNEVRKVADFPQVVGCVESAKSCRCYSQQGTEIESIGKAACRQRIRGRPFNPYKQPEQQMAQTVQTK